SHRNRPESEPGTLLPIPPLVPESSQTPDSQRFPPAEVHLSHFESESSYWRVPDPDLRSGMPHLISPLLPAPEYSPSSPADELCAPPQSPDGPSSAQRLFHWRESAFPQ